jgi:hypothetical protein
MDGKEKKKGEQRKNNATPAKNLFDLFGHKRAFRWAVPTLQDYRRDLSAQFHHFKSSGSGTEFSAK